MSGNFLTRYRQRIKKVKTFNENPLGTEFTFGINLLCYTGLWPSAYSDQIGSEYYPFYGMGYCVYHLVVKFLIFLIAFTMTLDLCKEETRHSIVLIGDDLSLLSGVRDKITIKRILIKYPTNMTIPQTWVVVFKTYYWYYYSDEIVKLFQHLDIYNKSIYSNEECVKKLRRSYYIDDYHLLMVLTISCSFMYLSFIVQPIVAGEHTLMFRAWFPFDATTTIGYTLAMVFQIVTSASVIFNVCFFEVIGVWAINQATLHLHVIKEKFTRLGMDREELRDDEVFQRTMEKKVDRLVRDHQDVMLIIDNIHKVFKTTYMVQVSASMLQICFGAFEVTLTMKSDIFYSMRFMSYMVSSLFQLMFWCWTGNRTFLVSAEIAEAIYTSNWVDMNLPLKKKIGFIMMRCQKPLQFSAYPLYILNYESFIAILSGSYSYFTLLRTLLED